MFAAPPAAAAAAAAAVTPSDLISAAFADKPLARKKVARLHDGQSLSPIDIAVFRAAPVGEWKTKSVSTEDIAATAAAAVAVAAATASASSSEQSSSPVMRTKSRSATGQVLNRKSVGFEVKTSEKIAAAMQVCVCEILRNLDMYAHALLH